MIATANVGDHAEAAKTIAAIGNLDVGNGTLDSTLDLRDIGRDLALHAKNVIDD